jgi:proteic killer suppression protein
MFSLKSNPGDVVQYETHLEKALKKLPLYIVEKLKMWAKTVNNYGISEARKCKGYHDEPLKGERRSQRSIRLSKSYRAIYIEDKNIIKITVIEVNKHEY